MDNTNTQEYFIWDGRLDAYYPHPYRFSKNSCSANFFVEYRDLRKKGYSVIFTDEHASKDSKEYLAYKIADTLLCSILNLPKPLYP